WRRPVILAEGFLDGTALRGEKFGAAFGNVHAVLEAYAEFFVIGNHRFVAKAHARTKRSFVAANQVRPLVSIESDAVTGAVRKSGDLVVRSEARIRDDLTRSRVDCFAGNAHFSCGKSGILGFPFEIPDVALMRRGFSKYNRAADVGLIAVHAAAAVHQDDIAF